MCKLHTSTSGNYSTVPKSQFPTAKSYSTSSKKKSKAPQSFTVNTVLGYSFKLKNLVRQGNNF